MREEDAAKGSIVLLKDYFVKVIVEKETCRILGAHIVSPHASILIQEVVNLMYTQERSAKPIHEGMHIHPTLSEVVECFSTPLRARSLEAPPLNFPYIN